MASISQRFLRTWMYGLIVSTALFFAFTIFIDPYGLWNSPGYAHINSFKPSRANLDRQIKPLEVLRDQPKTIFLGTSRAQEGFDPAVLNGTPYAPAYNGSVPGGTVVEDESLLRHYFETDRHLKHVVVEVFLYRIIMAQAEVKPRSLWDLTDNILPLFFSAQTMRQSIETLIANAKNKRDMPSLDAGGHWLPPDPYYADQNFNPSAFADSIAQIHMGITDMQIQDGALQSLMRMRDLCHKHGATFTIIFAPNHPWDDYRLLSLGYWNRVEDMYKKLSGFDEVISASQYNDWTAEPTTDQLPKGKRMQYWADPIHFNTRMGTGILKAWAGLPGDYPKNMVVRVTPENYRQVVKDRREGLARWMQHNTEFVAMFDKGRQFFCVDAASCKNLGLPYVAGSTAVLRGQRNGSVLTVDRVDYHIRKGLGGALESAQLIDNKMILRGWALDDRKGGAIAATGIAVVVNDAVMEVATAESRRYDIEAGFGVTGRVGFRVGVHMPPREANAPTPIVRVYALTADHAAVPIPSGLSVNGITILSNLN